MSTYCRSPGADLPAPSRTQAGVRIDEGVKREVLARTDIGEFIGNYVPLRKRGKDLVGLCPFHGEKTPSFHVHPDRGFFKCFGCGVGGDVLTFYQKLENVPFPDALRALAKRIGIEVEAETPGAARARSEKEAIYAANETAAAFFHRVLRLEPEAAAARDYCERRGLDAAAIEAFKLGYAPATWDALERELVRAGFEPELGVRAGLLRRGERGFYDFYRGRLMIPTYAATGEVVAFGGRSLDGSEPKYLNTSTTPVYTKGRGFYALNVARRAVQSFGALIVVEGYLDCIALHQAGFPAAVAALGTAFTADQAAELRKYTDRVFICFDADAAGGAATAKSIEILVAAGVSARIVLLPPGDDPDAFVRREGKEAFRSAARRCRAVDRVLPRAHDRPDPPEVRGAGAGRAQCGGTRPGAPARGVGPLARLRGEPARPVARRPARVGVSRQQRQLRAARGRLRPACLAGGRAADDRARPAHDAARRTLAGRRVRCPHRARAVRDRALPPAVRDALPPRRAPRLVRRRARGAR